MIRWAIIFLVVGLVLALLGFGGLGGAFIGIAKLLFFIAIAERGVYPEVPDLLF